MNKHILLFKLFERLGSRGWRGSLEGVRRLMGLFTRLLLTVLGKITKGHCLAVYAMSREIIRLYRKSGPLFLGQYLKMVGHQLQWYLAGESGLKPKMTTRVSLTRSGIPTFIPPAYRKRLRQGKNSAEVVTIVLSICSLSKLLLVPPKKGFKVQPDTIFNKGFQPSESCQKLCVFMAHNIMQFLDRYAPSFRRIPLNLGVYWSPTFSSGPNTYKKPSRESRVLDAGKDDGKMTIYHTFPLDILALLHLFTPEEIRDLDNLWFPFRTFNLDEKGAEVEPMPISKSGFGPLVDAIASGPARLWATSLKTRAELGRFGKKLEGSGKVRVFAIGSPILQACFRPLHNWVMSLLSTITMDGTYDQHAPLFRLQGCKHLSSFDLKSATDLLPAALTAHILLGLLGRPAATSWFRTMSYTPFRSPDRGSRPDRAMVLTFNRGQPLGFYSSWPLFTLTHHMLVWMAAERVQPGVSFRKYAILGDDIVIGCPLVSAEYAKIMQEAEGVISKEKTLVSDRGVCEFAKLLVIDNHKKSRVVIYPRSMRLIRSTLGFTNPFVFRKLGTDFRSSFRVRGGGYHVFSRLRDPWDRKVFHRCSRRWQRHWLSMLVSSGILPLPVEFWLKFPDEGCLDCYSLGLARSFILDKVKPRDLREEDFDRLYLYWEGDESAFVEFLIAPVIKLHLNYLKWYCSVSTEFNTPLSVLLEPPIAPRGLNRTSELSRIQRYGLLFKLWDHLRKVPAPKGLGSFSGCSKYRTFIYTF